MVNSNAILITVISPAAANQEYIIQQETANIGWIGDSNLQILFGSIQGTAQTILADFGASNFNFVGNEFAGAYGYVPYLPSTPRGSATNPHADAAYGNIWHGPGYYYSGPSGNANPYYSGSYFIYWASSGLPVT